MINNMNKPKVASMFAGIGGICLGFKQVECEIVWANEINPASCNTYRHNFGDKYLIESDIKFVKPADIPNFDILTAGFPCQSFSIGGTQRGFNDTRGTLFFEVGRIIEATRPKIVFLENVENLMEHDNGKTFLVIYNTLAQFGYGIRYKVMPSNEYGNLPQNRKRIYIVAFRDYIDCDAFSYPESIRLTQGIFDIINIHERKQEVYYYQPNTDLYKQLNLFIGSKNTIFRIYNGHIRNIKVADVCPTITASMNTPDNAVVLRDDYGIRRLTIRECLDLQGFPNEFYFPKTITIKDAYTQIGNSVSVPVIRRIAEKIVKICFQNN